MNIVEPLGMDLIDVKVSKLKLKLRYLDLYFLLLDIETGGFILKVNLNFFSISEF